MTDTEVQLNTWRDIHIDSPDQSFNFGKWGRWDLNPHDLLGSTDFHSPTAFAATFISSETNSETDGFENWTLPLPSTKR